VHSKNTFFSQFDNNVPVDLKETNAEKNVL